MRVRAERVDAGYDSRLVLREFCLEVESGEIVALVGPNGSGKSTVLRALGRVLRARSGVVYLDGRAIAELPPREVARRLSLLPQGPALSADLSVEELVWMGRSPHQGLLGLPTAADKRAVRRAMEETGVAALSGRSMGTLSGGEKQRAWIAMALAQEPSVLLLDEPTTFLDLSHQLDVLELVRYLNREHGLTVAMVLHDLNQAARFAQRVVVLNEGRVHSQGPPEAVLTVATLREVFGVDVRAMPGPDGVPLVIVPIGRVGAK